MSITHARTVSELLVLNDGTDMVSEVIIETTSMDNDLTSVTSPDRFELDTSGGTSATGFISYADLTEETVLGWLSSQIDASNIEKIHESQIAELKKSAVSSNKTLPF
jgi:hypothetical protein|tara:strand:+ start:110 stop:430 length:321 start_codon:yes stop_codon:yes gene_type:complete